MSESSSTDRTNAGSIAPSTPPTLAPQRLAGGDQPQSALGEPVTQAQISALYAPYKERLAEAKGTPWVHIIDADSGEVLLSENATSARTPASVAKVLTAMAAHYHLDENATLDTGVSVVGDKIFLWGNGDLLLGTEESSHDVNGRASLLELAQLTSAALKERKTSTVTLYWAPHPFQGPSRLPAWEPQEVTSYEGAVGAYAIDSGIIPGTNVFTDDPERFVADTFLTLLGDEGIIVQLGRQEKAPADAEEIARVHSATIGEQIRYMMAHSDNTMADQLCRLAAGAAGSPTSYAGATETIDNVAATLGVAVDTISLEDCSGLSSNNKILPISLTSVLRESAHSNRADMRDLVRSLPWAGAQGTMSRRHYDGTAIGNVQGKTGSLSQVSTLTGFVRTHGGRELVYAIGIDGTDEGMAYQMRPHIDAFIQELTTL